MEALAAYVPAVSCDSTDKPGSTSLGALLKATYPGTTYAISRACGSDVMSTTEHYDGRAVDWFTNVRTAEGKARGDALVELADGHRRPGQRGRQRPPPRGHVHHLEQPHLGRLPPRRRLAALRRLRRHALARQ